MTIEKNIKTKKTFQNYVRTHLGQNITYIYEIFRNMVHTNVQHIHYRARDATNTYHLPYTNKHLNIYIWDYIINFCSSYA